MTEDRGLHWRGMPLLLPPVALAVGAALAWSDTERAVAWFGTLTLLWLVVLPICDAVLTLGMEPDAGPRATTDSAEAWATILTVISLLASLSGALLVRQLAQSTPGGSSGPGTTAASVLVGLVCGVTAGSLLPLMATASRRGGAPRAVASVAALPLGLALSLPGPGAHPAQRTTLASLFSAPMGQPLPVFALRVIAGLGAGRWMRLAGGSALGLGLCWAIGGRDLLIWGTAFLLAGWWWAIGTAFVHRYGLAAGAWSPARRLSGHVLDTRTLLVPESRPAHRPGMYQGLTWAVVTSSLPYLRDEVLDPLVHYHHDRDLSKAHLWDPARPRLERRYPSAAPDYPQVWEDHRPEGGAST